jgi:glycine cleavage system H lipoate-binding protein
MTVLLILVTFAVFIMIDYLRNRGVPAEQPAPATPPQARLMPDVVAGFAVAPNVRYHSGHSWAVRENPGLVRIGLDDFAARLIGKASRILLPQRQRWIRQGQKICTIERDGMKVEMVSPIEGEVAEINEAVLRNPELALRDPYGEGWLATVKRPDAETNFRNLLGGTLARRWMEEAARRLLEKMPRWAGAVAQDGGVAVHDLCAHLPNQEWAELSREFFLS